MSHVAIWTDITWIHNFQPLPSKGQTNQWEAKETITVRGQTCSQRMPFVNTLIGHENSKRRGSFLVSWYSFVLRGTRELLSAIQSHLRCRNLPRNAQPTISSTAAVASWTEDGRAILFLCPSSASSSLLVTTTFWLSRRILRQRPAAAVRL